MHLTRKSTIGAVAALSLVPASALAATIQGGPGNERLRGTNAADVIRGNGGNDRVVGRAGDDKLFGGPGNDRIWGNAGDDTINGDTNDAGDRTSFDRLWGGAGNDTITGGDSRDLLSGGTGDDVQDGENGNDTIYANAGVDTSRGGAGNDTLWALARSDVKPGPNGEVDQVGDTLDGGPGDDTFRTRDGEVDRVTCGDGTDRAVLDQVDVITDATAENPNGSCEKVERKDPKVRDSASEDANQG